MALHLPVAGSHIPPAATAQRGCQFLHLPFAGAGPNAFAEMTVARNPAVMAMIAKPPSQNFMLAPQVDRLNLVPSRTSHNRSNPMKPPRRRSPIRKQSPNDLEFRSIAGGSMCSIAALRKLVSDSRERIKQRHAGHDNVRDVAGHKCQAAHFGSRRQQAIDQRQRIGNSQERTGLQAGVCLRKLRPAGLDLLRRKFRTGSAARRPFACLRSARTIRPGSR